MAWIARTGEVLPNIINVGDENLTNYLLIGEDKIVLIDCNMSFMSQVLIQNLRKYIPEGRTLDAILLTHSHFDHVGCLPHLREVFPDTIVYGHAYAQEVLPKPRAREIIYQFNRSAAKEFAKRDEHQAQISYNESKLYVDRTIEENDELSIGTDTIIVLETPGHTRCSLSFYLREQGILFPGESIGVLMDYGRVCPEYLTGFHTYMASLKKCRDMQPKVIALPHFGILTDEEAELYWDWALAGAKIGEEIITEMLKSEFTEEEIIARLKKEFYAGKVKEFQPEEAFDMNAKYAIKLVREECL